MSTANGGGLCIAGSDNCTGSNEVYLLLGIAALIFGGYVAYEIRWLGWREALIGLLPRRLRDRATARWLPDEQADEDDHLKG